MFRGGRVNEPLKGSDGKVLKLIIEYITLVTATMKVRDTRSSSHYIFDQSGAVLGYFGHRFHQDAGRPAPDETKRGNLRVPRKVLRQMLLDRLEPGTVRWGMSVIDFADSADPEGKVTISIAKAATGPAVEEIKADVLVAADGIRSKIRSVRIF